MDGQINNAANSKILSKTIPKNKKHSYSSCCIFSWNKRETLFCWSKGQTFLKWRKSHLTKTVSTIRCESLELRTKRGFLLQFSHFELHGIQQLSSERRHNITLTRNLHWNKAPWQRFPEPIHQETQSPLSGGCDRRPACQPPPSSWATLAMKVDIAPLRASTFHLWAAEEPATAIVALRAGHSRSFMEWITVSEWTQEELRKDPPADCLPLAFVVHSVLRLPCKLWTEHIFLRAYLMLVPSQSWPCVKIYSFQFSNSD